MIGIDLQDDDNATIGVGQKCKYCNRILKLYDVICVVKDGFAHLPCTVNPLKKSLEKNFN